MENVAEATAKKVRLRLPEPNSGTKSLCKGYVQVHHSSREQVLECMLHVCRWDCVSDTSLALQSFDTAAMHAVVERFQPAELCSAPRHLLRAHLEIQRTCCSHISLTDYLRPALDTHPDSSAASCSQHCTTLEVLLEEAAVLEFTSIALPRVDSEHLTQALSAVPGCRVEVEQGGTECAWIKCMPAVTAADLQFSAPICCGSDATTVQAALAAMPHLHAVTMPFFAPESEWQVVCNALQPLKSLRSIQISQSPCIDLCDAWNSNTRDAWHPISDANPLTTLFRACHQLTRLEMQLPVTRDQVFELVGGLSMLSQLQHLAFGVSPKHSECEATLVRDVDHHMVFLGKLQALKHLEITYWSHTCPLKSGDTARFLESLSFTLQPLSGLRVLHFYVHWQSRQDCLYIDQAASGATVAVAQQIAGFIDLAGRLDEVVVRGQHCDLLLPFARDLKVATSVRSVCLHDWRLQADSHPYMPQTILDLGCLGALVHLSLSIQWDMTEAWSKSLADCLNNLQQLERLELSCKTAFQSCFQHSAAEVVSSIAALPALQHLKVDFCKALFEFWNVFCDFQAQCPNPECKGMPATLSHLELSNVCSDMRGSAPVLQQLTSLTHLCIVHNEFQEAQEVSFLSSLKRLQHLVIEADFHSCEPAFETLGGHIGQLAALTHLQVKFHSCSYSGLSLFAQCLTSLRRLAHLNLCETGSFGHTESLLAVAEKWMDSNWKSICATLQDSWSSALHIPLLVSAAGLRVPVQSLRSHAACLVLFKQHRLMNSSVKSSDPDAAVASDAMIPAYMN